MATPDTNITEPVVIPAFGPRSTRLPDAIDLLKSDHAQVARWFDAYENALFEEDKLELAARICAALTIHAMLEEEIFYPAFIAATGRADMHHKAAVEHDSAEYLIGEIRNS